MCGRFTLRASTKDLRNAFPFVDLPDLTARYNIAPTQQVAAIRRTLTPASRNLRGFSFS